MRTYEGHPKSFRPRHIRQQYFPQSIHRCRLGVKATISKAKDLIFKAKAKNLASKAKAKDLTSKAKAEAKDLNVRHVGILHFANMAKIQDFS